MMHAREANSPDSNAGYAAAPPVDNSVCLEETNPPDVSAMLCSEGGQPQHRRNDAYPDRLARSKNVTFKEVWKQVRPPTVAGARVKFGSSGDAKEGQQPVLDLLMRDPMGLNQHCRVKFEDIIAEPDPTVFSFDCVWTLSYKVFTSTKLWCYRITSLIFAIPAAICWGIEFACLSFCTIWCWQPSLRAFEISLWYPRRVFEIILAVFLEPCCHTMGKCLSHIVVTNKQG